MKTPWHLNFVDDAEVERLLQRLFDAAGRRAQARPPSHTLPGSMSHCEKGQGPLRTGSIARARQMQAGSAESTARPTPAPKGIAGTDIRHRDSP